MEVQGISYGATRAIKSKNHPKWDIGRSGSLLKKNGFFFFFRETHFHSFTTQTQAVVTIYYHCIVFLLPFNGNSICYG